LEDVLGGGNNNGNAVNEDNDGPNQGSSSIPNNIFLDDSALQQFLSDFNATTYGAVQGTQSSSSSPPRPSSQDNNAPWRTGPADAAVASTITNSHHSSECNMPALQGQAPYPNKKRDLNGRMMMRTMQDPQQQQQQVGASRVSSTSSFTSSMSSTPPPLILSSSSVTGPSSAKKIKTQHAAAFARRAPVKNHTARQSAAANNKKKLGRPSLFPQKLFTMLSELQTTDEYESLRTDVCNFCEDGSAFEIYNIPMFVEHILPKFFKMTSFSSFQRQLQLYNFKRVSKNSAPKMASGAAAYRHDLFHRDRPNDLERMERKQSKPSTFVMALHAKS